jgi:predicted dehydrogenase/threonine dehydrogenase-like Zn-dependent dehydrogenase
MKVVAQNYRDGSLTLVDAPPPALKRGGVLVHSRYSVISTGTEMMKVAESKLTLVGKARARPDQVKKVLQTVAQQGPVATFRKVMAKLDSYTPLGYSISGVVAAVGEGVSGLRVGDRVACMGSQYALHAETNWVPVNMCAVVPDDVSDEAAAFGTVGAISMQGFRQSDLKLGEVAVVVGLGLLGQILVRILRAAGVHVFGLDPDEERCSHAVAAGAARAAAPGTEAFQALREQLLSVTAGAGADCVLLTAAGPTNSPIEMAGELLRDRGRVVDVGKCGMNLPWDIFAAKELEVRFSRSYGPGRYDPNYEEHGIDYPIGYVRWTQQRNLTSFVSLVSNRQLDLEPLISSVHAFDDAVEVYERMGSGALKGIGHLFRYETAPLEAKSVITSPVPSPRVAGRLRIGVIGCGAYASSMLLPHLKSHGQVELVEAATSSSLSAANARRKFGFSRISTDPDALILSSDIDAIFILTPHASHARFAAAALHAGKAVFLEKPLAVNEEELSRVVSAVEDSRNDRIMVGFNRRFAPGLRLLRRAFLTSGASETIQYTINAGRLDPGSWHADRAGHGSRIVGEACHFIDTASWWLNDAPVRVFSAQSGDDPDNMIVTVHYSRGAVASVSYLTGGDPRLPKERFQVTSEGATGTMDNFNGFQISRGGSQRAVARRGGKGQKEELVAFIEAVRAGGPMPIGFRSLVETTAATFAAERSAAEGRAIDLQEILERLR